jgi:hypothetical protein
MAGWTPAGAATQGSFQPAGHLFQARNRSQATLLTDGKVLITGGYQFIGMNGEAIPFAEIFDPATGQSTALPPLSEPRDDSERSVLLKDGRVLIVSGGETRLVEIFEPTTRLFDLAGLMLHVRGGPTATVIPDGRVLIAGGFTAFGPTDPEPPVTESAELFDPVSGKSQPTGSLSMARYRHSAVTLPDGRIALLGGYGVDGQVLSSVEIYDPRTGIFTPGGELAEARADMTAHLLPDGRVLVVGGLYTNSGGQVVGARRSVEVYDPAAGRSAVTDTLPGARWFHAAAELLDGRVLIAGGVDFSSNPPSPLGTAFVVDPTTGRTSPMDPMTAARGEPTAVALPDGRVLIIGGRNPSSLDSVEAYVPAAPATAAPQ